MYSLYLIVSRPRGESDNNIPSEY